MLKQILFTMVVLVAIAILFSCSTTMERVEAINPSINSARIMGIQVALISMSIGELDPDQESMLKQLNQLEITAGNNTNNRILVNGLRAWYGFLTKNQEMVKHHQLAIAKIGKDTEWYHIVQALLSANVDDQLQILENGRHGAESTSWISFFQSLIMQNKGLFHEAVAYLDEALSGWPENLKREISGTIYPVRARWIQSAQLQPGSQRSSELIAQKSITFNELVELLKLETKLAVLFAVETVSSTELGLLMIDCLQLQNVIENTSNPVLRKQLADTLFALLKDYGNDKKLTQKYLQWLELHRPGSQELSYIADMKVEDQHYFKVKTLVEQSIVSLPNGKDFFPGEPVSAKDAMSSLKSLERSLATAIKVKLLPAKRVPEPVAP